MTCHVGLNFGNGVALGGVDMAVNDLRGEFLGLPLAELFGGRMRQRVVACVSTMNYIEHINPLENTRMRLWKWWGLDFVP